MLSGGSLSHQLKLPSTIALSSCEAKYMTITEARKVAVWVTQFLACLKFCLPSQLINLCADNKGIISLTEHLEFYPKTKHIKVC